MLCVRSVGKMQISDVLSRAGDDGLQELLGSSTVRLLNNLDSKLARASSMREIFEELYSPVEMLRNGTLRKIIFTMLKTDEATELCSLVYSNPPSNPFEGLNKLSFVKASSTEKTVFDYFSVPHPEDESKALELNIKDLAAQRANRFYQLEAINKVLALYSSNQTRVLLHMPTGSGKTRTAMQIIVRMLQENPEKLVIWLAYSEELCEQAAQEFEQAWVSQGDRDIQVQRFWGDYNDSNGFISEGFMVAGLSKMHSLVKKADPRLPKLADNSCLVVIDEAHQAIAETYRLVLEILAKNLDSRILGLTATPGRTWNDPEKDAHLADFFNRTKVTLEIDGYKSPIDYLIAEGYLADPEFEKLEISNENLFSPAELTELQKVLEIPTHILKKLGEDDIRNLKIISKLEDLMKSHKRILFFATTVEHSALIASVLQARGHSAFSVTGTTSAFDRQRVIAKYKSDSEEPIVLCNFGVLTTGFDAPRTSCAFIARPTASLVLYSQMVGRALRGPKSNGNKVAKIVTVVDTALPGFRSPAEAFMNWEDVW
jgi:superfamily II DNA or RNA helicase